MKKFLSVLMPLLLIISAMFSLSVFSSAKDPVKPGDVNADGKITISDAKCVLKYAVGLTDLSDAQFSMADVNHNGKVGIEDAKIILRCVVGLQNIPGVEVGSGDVFDDNDGWVDIDNKT